MREIELKFQIPTDRRAPLRRAVETATAKTERLRASYFDTPDRRLARAGVALRLRQEGRRWVQTLKATGANPIDRLEHNVPVSGTGNAMPPLLIERHAHTEAGERLLHVMARVHKTTQQTPTPSSSSSSPAGSAASQLQCLFSTDIHRISRRIRTRGAVIELAFDRGEIVAGEHRLPVCEIEFELVSGSPQAMLAVAAQWVRRHGLWLDVRSKAERGDRLARDVALTPAAKAVPVDLTGISDPDAALRAMVGNALQQALANAADVADGPFGPEHVHQLRVALRRMRSALKELGHAGDADRPPWSPHVDPAWEPALAEQFARLGSIRDRDVLLARWMPRLQAAGVPAFDLPAAPDSQDPGSVLREGPMQVLWLQLLGFAMGSVRDVGELASQPQPQPLEASTAAAAETPSPGLIARAGAALERLWRQLRPAARRFGKLDDEARHRLRKRLKRLRYVAEFVAPLFSSKRVERFLAALRRAQEALGDYNDAIVARDLFVTSAAQHPQAWFAVGWADAEQSRVVARCENGLATLLDARRFWRSPKR